MRIKPAQKTPETVKTSDDGLFGFSKDFSWEVGEKERNRLISGKMAFDREDLCSVDQSYSFDVQLDVKRGSSRKEERTKKKVVKGGCGGGKEVNDNAMRCRRRESTTVSLGS
ncbi:hypothetical protein K0M31_010745 [Melipona bicolor]|uniref:Uncharacterized protein n=1 Tax=Melipona bicolor TaxID=60889 RepID=A0AA40KHZ5_9HYME|nr:hypothetical protein K0M31_010745 [Melipona bicolor]